jgi:hypothetical protein
MCSIREATSLATKILICWTAPEWQTQALARSSAHYGELVMARPGLYRDRAPHKMLQRYWTRSGQTQQQIKMAVTEPCAVVSLFMLPSARRSRLPGFSKNRRALAQQELDVKWEHFVSKMEPNQKETWTAVISKPKAASNDAKGED